MEAKALSQLLDKFVEFESTDRLFEVVVKERKFWDYIRYAVFSDIVLRQHDFQWRGPSKKRYLRYIRELFQYFVWLVREAAFPKAHKKYDILIVDYDRNNYVDGKEVNISFYSVIKELSPRFRILLINSGPLSDGADKKYPCDVLCSRWFHIVDRLKSFFIVYHENEKKIFREISTKVKSLFGVEVDIEHIARFVYSFDMVRCKRYRKILENYCPSVVMYADNGNEKAIIEAAHSLGIPTIDFQHSLVSPVNHLYTYPKDIGKYSLSTLSDYIFTFGDFWHAMFRLPVKMVSVGFPYFEMKKKEMMDKGEHKRGNNIIMITDQFSKEKYIEVALGLSRQLPDYTIFYKLRADDYPQWQERYPKELQVAPNIKVVDNHDISLYEYFSICSYQIGVNSTALYEGLGFDLVTFVLKEPWHEEMGLLIDSDSVFLVESEEEIVAKIKSGEIPKTRMATEEFFKSGSLENIERAFKSVLREREPSWGVL